MFGLCLRCCGWDRLDLDEDALLRDDACSAGCGMVATATPGSLVLRPPQLTGRLKRESSLWRWVCLHGHGAVALASNVRSARNGFHAGSDTNEDSVPPKRHEYSVSPAHMPGRGRYGHATVETRPGQCDFQQLE